MATAVTLLRAASPGLAAGDASRECFQCSRLLPKKKAPQKILLCSLKYGCLDVDPGEAGRMAASPVYSSLSVSPVSEAAVVVTSSEQKVYDVVLKQAALLRRQLRPQQQPAAAPASEIVKAMPWGGLKEAYGRCGEICEEYAPDLLHREMPIP